MNNVNQILYCRFCGKECHNTNSLKNHEIRCPKNPEHIESVCKGNTAKFSWSKGLTKYTDERVLKNSENVKAYYKEHNGTFKGRKHTEESKRKISMKMKGNHHNNPSKTGRGKKGIYKGFYCASTYELAFIIYCLDNKINIQKCPYYYNYEYKGENHRYYPDFIIDGVIYEIKGYWTELVDIKTKSVNDRLIKVLYKKDMQHIFDYIYTKYGKIVDKNLEDLYEERK